jgi:hypothetical protein
VVSIRHAASLAARARAAVVLERDGPIGVLGQWRADPDLAEVRWQAGGRPTNLHEGVRRLLDAFRTSGDPAAGLALVWTAQALVLARLDEGPEPRA